MATDLKRLKQHFKAYEPTLKELERKYQVQAAKWEMIQRSPNNGVIHGRTASLPLSTVTSVLR